MFKQNQLLKSYHWPIYLRVSLLPEIAKGKIMWKSLRKKGRKLSPAQVIVSYYLFAVTASTLLLSLPIALRDGVEISFLDALFTAVSAVSVTGLSTINISETYTVTGYFILMFVFQIGGIGVMTLGTFFWVLVGKKIGLRDRRLIMTDQNQSNLSGLVKLTKQIWSIILVIEVVGALILGFYFLHYYPTWEEAFLHGLFTSVSATTNAGFDITGASLIPFAHDYFVQIVIIILITLGAIGFPVLIEAKEYLKGKHKPAKFRFSLNTKITTVTFSYLLIFGTVIIYIFEIPGLFRNMEWHEALFYSIFQSATTRSSGLATMDVGDFSEPTLLVLSILMFIGASPSSVGGGIRTTTLALNVLFLYHFAKGNQTIKVFKREIHQQDIIKSFVVTLMASIICFIAVVLLSLTEGQTLVAIIFEVGSAFGTTGLSVGITSELTAIGKLIIIILMFIGRVGILLFLFMIGGNEKRANYHYPKEKIIIG